jgi:hypothetical protein
VSENKRHREIKICREWIRIVLNAGVGIFMLYCVHMKSNFGKMQCRIGDKNCSGRKTCEGTGGTVPGE